MKWIELVALFFLSWAMAEGFAHDKPPPYAQTALVMVLVLAYIWRQIGELIDRT